MTSQMIVVDTNVWLDYFFGYRSHHESSMKFMVEAVKRDLPLVVPVHSLKDIFFVSQVMLKEENRRDGKQPAEAAAQSARQVAWALLDQVMEIAAVGPADQPDAQIASKQRHIHDDFEDDLVIATAMRLDARLLVTNDLRLVAHAPVPCMTAEDALAFISAA